MAKKLDHGLIPIALPPHWSISPKMQLLICLAIGNVMGALVWNPPAHSWDLGSWVTDSVNSAYSALNGTTEAQTPVPVPPGQPPIGNSATIQPCAAPPPVASSPPVAAPIHSSVQKVEEPEDRTIWLASHLKYPQKLTSIVDTFGTPSYSHWDFPRSVTTYTTQTGKEIEFEIASSRDNVDHVIGYRIK